MRDELKNWANDIQKMDKNGCDPKAIWDIFRERSAEIQSILFDPESSDMSEDISDDDIFPEDQQAVEYIVLLLEKRGWTSKLFSEIHIELTPDEPPIIRKLCSLDGTTVVKRLS